jgi:hypothetical protein
MQANKNFDESPDDNWKQEASDQPGDKCARSAREARTRRDEERFKAELEAARTVQQVLIPEETSALSALVEGLSASR